MKKTLCSLMLICALALACLPAAAAPASALGDMGKIGQYNTISLSDTHSALIDQSGDLYTWGMNNYGQLGHNVNTPFPTKVPGISNVVSVSLGALYSAAITANGELYTWGMNVNGVLGRNSSAASLPLGRVSGLSNVVAVGMGDIHSAAITANGDLYTWGSNTSGELGHSQNERFVMSPTKVPSLSNVIAVSLGADHSAAITANGDLYTWGKNDHGQLGHSGAMNVSVPTKLSVPSIATDVSLGWAHTALITRDGDFSTWGWNENLQANVDGEGVTATSVGFRHSAAIADGDLYTWGNNYYGQLGIGIKGDDMSFNKVSGISNVVAVNLGCDHSAAITANGNLYTWGRGLFLGIEDYLNDKASPQLVGSNIRLPTDTPPTVAKVYGLNNFSERSTYTSGQFSDVDENAWYGYNNQGSIARTVRLGFVAGYSDGSFMPTGNLLRAEAIKMACVAHNIYWGGNGSFVQGTPWYQVYVDYALANGIMDTRQFYDESSKTYKYDATCTRGEMAYLFAHAVPVNELGQINTVSSLPDVTSNTIYYSEIFTLYRAGVITGSDNMGTYNPYNTISRAEACAIIARISVPSMRQNLSF